MPHAAEAANRCRRTSSTWRVRDWSALESVLHLLLELGDEVVYGSVVDHGGLRLVYGHLLDQLLVVLLQVVDLILEVLPEVLLPEQLLDQLLVLLVEEVPAILDVLEFLPQLDDLLSCLLLFGPALAELGLEFFDLPLRLLRLGEAALILHLQEVLLTLHVVDVRGYGEAIRAILPQAPVVRAVRHALRLHLSLPR